MRRQFDPLNKYEQKDNKHWLHIVTIGHLLLAVFLLLPNPGAWATNYNALICIIYSLFFLLITYSYKWKDPVLNSAISFTYIFSIIVEFSVAGIPGAEHMLYFNAHRLEVPAEPSILIDSLLFTIPIIYFAIRICLIIPINSIVKRKNLNYSIHQSTKSNR